MLNKQLRVLQVIFFFLGSSANLYAGTWKKSTTTTSSSPSASGTAGTALLSSQCPTGFIFVPKNTSYTPVDFCVMKYEAKNDGYGTATSTAAGFPWVSINRATARSACQNLGAGYDMISNDQWQTIARNIAGVASNWDSGVVASGQLNRGHSDNAPASALVAVTDDNDPCSGTGQTCSSSVWDRQRRTHNLSNGNVIWDMAGNVAEWVTNDSNVSNGADGYISTMSGGDIRQTRYGALGSTICASPSSAPYCGMGHGSFNYSGGAITRGRGWVDGPSSGVFTANLNTGTTTSYISLGFRCVFIP